MDSNLILYLHSDGTKKMFRNDWTVRNSIIKSWSKNSQNYFRHGLKITEISLAIYFLRSSSTGSKDDRRYSNIFK